MSTSKQETARQHDDLDPISVKVFEEKTSGKLARADRPGLHAALAYLRPGDMLTVQEADRLGRNLLEGLLVLNDLFQQGGQVKVLHGIAAGEHTERSLILDLDLAATSVVVAANPSRVNICAAASSSTSIVSLDRLCLGCLRTIPFTAHT